MTKQEKEIILNKASSFLDDESFKKLEAVLDEEIDKLIGEQTNESLLSLFETAKNVEGCFPKSMKYYLYILGSFFKTITKGVKEISTDDIRFYLEILICT